MVLVNLCRHCRSEVSCHSDGRSVPRGLCGWRWLELVARTLRNHARANADRDLPSPYPGDWSLWEQPLESKNARARARGRPRTGLHRPGGSISPILSPNLTREWWPFLQCAESVRI